MATERILIVDDEETLCEVLKLNLENEGYDVDTAFSAEQALGYNLKEYSLILLDIMMGEISGIKMAKILKADIATADIPIIFCTARDTEDDMVMGLNLGADDYIMKPFDSKELVARVKAVLRRYQPAKAIATATPATKCVEYPDLTINLSNYSVIYNGNQVDMPPKELELLYFLASSPNQVFTREQLLDHIWGYEYIGDTRTVDVHVKRLREKIKDHEKWQIATVWGIGYKFEVK